MPNILVHPTKFDSLDRILQKLLLMAFNWISLLLTAFLPLASGETLVKTTLDRPVFLNETTFATSINGDLWLGHLKGKSISKIKWVQLTNTPADERSPQWMPDDKTLLYASDSNGVYDLWTLNTTSKELSPQIWLKSDQHDSYPSVASNGLVVWVKGIGPSSSLWAKEKNKEAKVLVDQAGEEAMPSLAPDAKSVVYVYKNGRQHQLRQLQIGKKPVTISGTSRPEFPSYSPDGKRISYTTRGQNSAIWISDIKGSYHNKISTQRASSSWFPDGSQLMLSALKAAAPYHNGDWDPDGARYLESPFSDAGQFHILPVAPGPDAGIESMPSLPEQDQVATALASFEQVVQTLDKYYQKRPNAVQNTWNTLVTQYRSKITQATSGQMAEQLQYQFTQERPYLREQMEGKSGVSSAHPLASAAGQEILQKGGNVVDAAVAVSLALGVVEPDASGLGGYGEMLIYLKDQMESPTCIEFLTRVPQAASLDNGQLNPLPQGGPIMVNIPGTLAGMELAWKKYGSKIVSWSDIVAPAIRLAEEGYVLDGAFPTTLLKEKEQYLKYPSSKALFFPNGKALRPGDTFRNPDLANTLKAIAKGGAKAFYEGEIAKKMVKDLKQYGNVMTLEDMSRYYAVERKPVKTIYRGHEIYSGPPPVSGGANLIGQLNALENFQSPQDYRSDAATAHAMIEAWKLAPSGRGKIADPGLWPVDLSDFTNKESTQNRWERCFDPEQALRPDRPCQDTRTSEIQWGADKVLDAKSNTGTTAFTVADADGNMVSVTQTLGTWGGNFYVSPGLGFLYNDKLGSYSTNPKSYNARVPFARNVTSITPTLVFKGTGAEKESLLAVGAAGNAWITSAVYQILTGVIDQELDPQAAIELPRFLVGVSRDSKNPEKILSVRIQAEDGFAPGVLEALKKMGHEIQLISNPGELRMGYSAAILVKDGKVIAGADPRRSGEARILK